MGLTYCTQCQTLEGRTEYVTLTDLNAKEYDGEPGDEVIVCRECDGVETIEFVPEHDDYDMER